MLKTKTMFAIASLLTVTAAAIASGSAQAAQHSHRMDDRAAAARFYGDARAQGPSVRYNPADQAFEPTYGAGGETLFDRAKGNID